MISNKELNRLDPEWWQLKYVKLNNPLNGKKVGFVRFDFWEGEFRMWEEKDFLEHIKKLKGANQK